jgi:hypothetical protein
VELRGKDLLDPLQLHELGVEVKTRMLKVREEKTGTSHRRRRRGRQRQDRMYLLNRQQFHHWIYALISRDLILMQDHVHRKEDWRELVGIVVRLGR